MANINIREFIDDLREEVFETGEPATMLTFDRSAIIILAKHLDGTTKQLTLPIVGLTRGQKAAATRKKNHAKAQRQALGSGINGGDTGGEASTPAGTPITAEPQ